MSSESHKNARKMLSFNTLAFGITSLYFVYTAVILLRELVTKGTLMTGAGIFSILALVGFVFISLRHFRRSWRSFSDLNYKSSVQSGFIAWLYPLAMIVLTFLF